MQRMKPVAMSAFSMAIAAAGIAHAGDPQHDPAGASSPQPSTEQRSTSQQGTSQQGGRDAQPAPRTGSAAPADATLSGSASRSLGANRMQVEQLQRELASRGLYRGSIDGIAGAQTMAALRQFQEQQGLPTNAGFDESTRQALGMQLDRQRVSGAQTSAGPDLERPVGREGTTPAITGTRPARSQVQLDTLSPDQLRTLQTRLQQFGFYQGEVDGVLGEGTRTALRQFYQTQADLASRGIITDATIGVFGVSPQGLNGASPSVPTSPQRGTQPRTDARGNPTPSLGSEATGTRSSSSGSSVPAAPQRGNSADRSPSPGGATPAPGGTTPNRSVPPAGGTSAPGGGTTP